MDYHICMRPMSGCMTIRRNIMNYETQEYIGRVEKLEKQVRKLNQIVQSGKLNSKFLLYALVNAPLILRLGQTVYDMLG